MAVAVELDSGNTEYCLTWGRIQDAIEPKPLEELILERYQKRHSNDEVQPVSARVCDTLQDAVHVATFFECFFGMCQKKIPFGEDTYWPWRDEMDKLMREGREIWFLV